jgi:hypothetical protein
MASNTVGSVINRAIELAQLDSGFLPLARQYYNLALNQAVTEYDWPYYRTQASDVAFTGVTSYDLPTDYNRSDTCFLVDSNGGKTPITIISKYRFDKLVSGSLNGSPSLAYIDLSNRKIIFNSAPDGTKSYRLTYFRVPDEIDESGGDDSEVIDFENTMSLIYSIAAMLMDYSDDERAPMFQQKADMMLRGDKMNAADEDNDPRIELGPSFRTGRRPTRNGYFGGF